MQSNSTRKRRSLRFTLRSLFGAMTLAAVCLAIRERPPRVQVVLDSPQFGAQKIANSASNGVWPRLPVRITNTGNSHTWFCGYADNAPFYVTGTRATDSTAWTDNHLLLCGVGLGMHCIPPGGTATFDIGVSPKSENQQLIVTIDFYNSSHAKRAFPIRSNIVLIR